MATASHSHIQLFKKRDDVGIAKIRSCQQVVSDRNLL